MSDDDEGDSLFGFEDHSDTNDSCEEQAGDLRGCEDQVASSADPKISGLYYFPTLLSRQLHDEILKQVADCAYFSLEEPTEEGKYARSTRNQVMLFGRSQVQANVQAPRHDSAPTSGLPQWAEQLISHLEQLLDATLLPLDARQQLFPEDSRLSRQLILNLYTQGEGLAAHVDLVHRFADGIVLCSFGPTSTGTVMDFYHPTKPTQHLFLPSGSVVVLTKAARYDWKHGITARNSDLIQHGDGTITNQPRSLRLSITIRSMLPGADVIGE